MDQGHAAVRKGEHDGVLVLHAARAEQPPGRRVELEPVPVPLEVVGADAPGPAAVGGRQVRIRHHEVRAALAVDPLHAGVFEAVDAARAPTGEHVPELVGVAVVRRENQDVRDVVDEARAGPASRSVAGAHGTGEEVIDAVLVEKAGVEHRSVPKHRTGLDDRPVAQPAQPQLLGWRNRAFVHGTSRTPRDQTTTRFLGLRLMNPPLTPSGGGGLPRRRQADVLSRRACSREARGLAGLGRSSYPQT